jgi:hypothetical protein
MTFAHKLAARARPARRKNPVVPQVPFTASLEAYTNAWRITIRTPAGFVAHADFPLSMGGVAHDRYVILQTDQDVEDLLREFGEDKDYHAWQRLT